METLSFSRSSSANNDLVARFVPLFLDAAASQFELQKYSSASKNSSARGDYPYSSWPGCYGEKERGRRDASTVVALYQQLLQSDGKASELLTQIRSQTESLPCHELDRLVIPLLEQMMPIMDLCSVETSQVFQSMMMTYMTRVVQKEPAKPSDWARPNEYQKCYRSDCAECKLLQEFLMDPEEESRSFILGSESWHQESSVPWQCKKSIDNSRNPRVLIVTKTLKRWEEEHSEWQKRASKVQESFRQLPQKELQQCLGESYDAIMDLRMVKLQDEDSTAQTADTSEKGTGTHSREPAAQPRQSPRKRRRSNS